MDRPAAVKMNGQPRTLAGPELKPGDSAPDFRCVNTKMQPIRLADTGNTVRILSVVPSLDTPICDMQTKRFNDESAKSAGIEVYSISTDLPFAERRYCDMFGIDHVTMLSDHLDTSFGLAYGVLLPDLRILARALFVIDQNNVIRHAEYVPEVTEHPNYEAALAVARQLIASAP
jgi:thiol peroxidase